MRINNRTVNGVVKGLLGLAVLVSPVIVNGAIATSVNVGWPSAPQSEGCRGQSICSVNKGGTQVLAFVNVWTRDLRFIVSGAIWQSIPEGGTVSTNASTSATITDFEGKGQNVLVTNHCDDQGNCQEIDVYRNGDFIARLGPGQDTVIGYQSGEFKVVITAYRLTATVGDYVGYYPSVVVEPAPINRQQDCK